MGTKSNDGNVVAALLLRITTRPELNCLKQDDKVLLREICKWEFSSRLKSLFLRPISWCTICPYCCQRIYIWTRPTCPHGPAPYMYPILIFALQQNPKFGIEIWSNTNSNIKRKWKKLHWSPNGHQYFRHYLVGPSKKNGYRLFPIAEVLYSYFTYSKLCKQLLLQGWKRKFWRKWPRCLPRQISL